MSLTIDKTLRAHRRRALESQANTGTHAWDTTPGAWDSESDCEAYCLDAIDAIPAGSTRLIPSGPASRMTLREPYPCEELRA